MSPDELLLLTPRKTFFELMRRLDAMRSAGPGASMEARRRPPKWLRLEQAASMHFASTEVAAVTMTDPAFGGPDATPVVRVVQRHFGLFAPYGPLPLHVTEHAMLEKTFERNAAFEQFLNLISTDMAWLHYQAYAAMHPTLGYERPRHAFVERVVGMARVSSPSDTPPAAGRHPRACRSGWPGLYVASQRPLRGLQRLLRAYFRTPIEVTPRAGRWMSVPGAGAQSRNLGRWRVGSRVWDAQNTLDVEVGAIDAASFHRWQRASASIRALVDVVTDYTGGSVHPVVHVLVRTSPDLAGRVGGMRVGVDAWACPTHALRRLTVYESMQEIS